MGRAGIACRVPGCANLQPCPLHPARKAWTKPPGTEPDRLRGPGLQKRNRVVMNRHGGVCYICGRPGADMVDHVVPLAEGGSDSDPANLRPAHSKPCHERKTLAEARRGTARGRGSTP